MQEKTEWFLCIPTVLRCVHMCFSVYTRLRETTTLTDKIYRSIQQALYYFIHLTEIKTFYISVAVYTVYICSLFEWEVFFLYINTNLVANRRIYGGF